VLWGNHDVAALIGQVVTPQDPGSWRLRPRFLEHFRAADWKLALCVDGVLVTHAGLSRVYRRDFARCARDPARLATQLNAEFRAVLAVAAEVAEVAVSGAALPADLDPVWPDEDQPSLLDDMGPLWFRPDPAFPRELLQGVTQVCGHSALDGADLHALAGLGVYVIDPSLVLGLPHDLGVTYRYAVIEGGAVRVEEGVVTGVSDSPPT
jgi:hypothetical protein